MKDSLSNNLKNYRSTKGITQKELAERLNLSENYICQLEAGRKSPSLPTLESIATEINMPLSFLVDDSLLSNLKKSLINKSELEKLIKNLDTIKFDDSEDTHSRTPVVTDNNELYKVTRPNPIARKYNRILKEKFGLSILPDKSKKVIFKHSDAPLYCFVREWLDDTEPKKDSEMKYEDLLHSYFWDITNHIPLVFISGDIGCGKSTLIEYYLRSFCPNDPETGDKFNKKIVLSVNCKGIDSKDDFEYFFYKKAKFSIEQSCKECGFDIKKKLNDGDYFINGYREWTDSALECISKDKNKGAPKYIVILFDNLDQADPSVQQLAITHIRQWIEDPLINVWQAYIPLWPTTLSKLNETLGGLPQHTEIKLGPVSTTQIISSRADGINKSIQGIQDEEYETLEEAIKYISDSTSYYYKYPELPEIIEGLTNHNLRSELDILIAFLSSNVMYNFHVKKGKEPALYSIYDSLLSGSYPVYHPGKSRILNIFDILRGETESFRDLLIGFHLLIILGKRLCNTYDGIRKTLRNLGYQTQDIQTAILIFEEFNFFHKIPKSPIMQSVPFEVHSKVISAYRRLIFKDAYLDNMSMVTPVIKKFKKNMTPTSSSERDEFYMRVKTTIQFISQIREDEASFCKIDSLSYWCDKPKFVETLDQLKIPFAWKSASKAYETRLRTLKDRDFLKGAKGVNDEWWDLILNDPIFKESSIESKTLIPNKI